jgi:LysM repeat protein
MRLTVPVAALLIVAAACGGGGGLSPGEGSPEASEGGASPTPSTAGSCRQATYVVESGDTLLAIAIRFDVELDQLQRANSIANPNVLAIGQVLEIPCPQATHSPVKTGQATVSPRR